MRMTSKRDSDEFSEMFLNFWRNAVQSCNQISSWSIDSQIWGTLHVDLDLVLSQEYDRDVHFTLGTQVQKGPFFNHSENGSS